MGLKYGLFAMFFSCFILGSFSQAAQGSIQGVVLDGSGRVLNLPGAAVVLQNMSTGEVAYSNANPDFYSSLEEADYYVSFKVPGQRVQFSVCGNCTDHSEESFREGEGFPIHLTAGQFVDVHFMVLAFDSPDRQPSSGSQEDQTIPQSPEDSSNLSRDQELLPGSYTGGLARVLDCSTPGVCAYDTNPKPINATGTEFGRYSYAYAPAIVAENNVDHIFYCSYGQGQGYDYIRYFNSQNMKIKVATYSFGQDRKDLAACDPSVVYFQGYYYMFYSNAIGTENPGQEPFQQNVLNIARATSLSGDWFVLNTENQWEQNSRHPKVIMGPAVRRSSQRSPYEIGLAWPSAVVKDGQIHLFFVDDSTMEEEHFKQYVRPVFHLVTSDPANWDRNQARFANLTNIHSGEVKYDPTTGQFLLFEIVNEHTAGAYAQVRSSTDGIGESWSAPRPLTGIMEGAHNIGIRSDSNGWLLPENKTQIMFGLPWGGRPKSQDVWTEWDLYTTYIQR